MKWIMTLLWMAIFIFAILFSVQNREMVTLRFSLYPLEDHLRFEAPNIPLFLVILCSVFLGVFMGGIGDLYKRVQLKRALRRSQKTIERLEREVHLLRGVGLDQPSPFSKEA